MASAGARGCIGKICKHVIQQFFQKLNISARLITMLSENIAANQWRYRQQSIADIDSNNSVQNLSLIIDTDSAS